MTEINSSPYKGSAQITREQFLFYEMRTTAKLICEGLEDNEIIDRIVEDNLFQYPTEKSIRRMAKACIVRLKGICDIDLVEAGSFAVIGDSKANLFICDDETVSFGMGFYDHGDR